MGVSVDMLAMVRMAAFLPDAHPDYTDAQLRKEMTQTLHTVFGEIVVNARAGYWRDEYIVSTTTNRGVYRIPYRAIVGSLEHIEIANGTGGDWTPLTEVSPERASELVGPSGTPTTGVPTRFLVDGDQIQLIPRPDSGSYSLKMRYYRRPSRMVDEQTRGLISAVNTTARTITVNVIPFDQELGTPAAITSGQQTIDVIHPGGWHEVALTGASQTWSGLTFTIGGTLDMTKIEQGDYVRVAEQSEWPAIPEEFYRTLADATAVEILTAMGAGQKGAQIAQKMGADLMRLRRLLTPRVKDSPPIIRSTQGLLFQRSSRSWPVRYP